MRILHKPLSPDQLELVKHWIRRLHTTCVLHKERLDAHELFEHGDQEAMRVKLELFCDLNDHLKLHHCLAGHASIGVADILLFSYLRRFMGLDPLDKDATIEHMLYPLKTEQLPYLTRFLTHLCEVMQVGFEAVDRKEFNLFKQMQHLNRSMKLLEAVKRNNVDIARLILSSKPNAL